MSNGIEWDNGKGRLSDADAAQLSSQIASLTNAGLPLAPGLKATAEEMPRGRLRSTLESVAKALESGASVDEALEMEGKRLPGHLKGLVKVGSRTGRTTQVLGQFVALTNVGTELRRGLWVSIAYPVISLAIALAVFMFVSTGPVRSFESIFRDFGISLPMLTIVLLRIAHLFEVSWQSFIEIVVGLTVLWLFLFIVLDASARRSIMGRIPILGPVWRNASLSEFCSLLALLLESRLPLGEALRLTGEGVRDASIERVGDVLAKDVESGMSLAEALAARPVFPKGLSRVIRWAEGNQTLPGALQMAGEMFEARARAQVGLAGTVFAVFAVVMIFAGVAIVVLGLFLPLITLITRLSG